MPSAATIETRLFNAVIAWNDGVFKFKTQCAKEFKVPYSLFNARLKGAKKSHGGQNTTLSTAQENALRSYINSCVYMGNYPDRRMIKRAANTILSYGGVVKTVSAAWMTRFLQRYPEFTKRKSQPIAAERQAAGERGNVEKQFAIWKEVMDTESLVPSDIWNFDETGFRIGCLRGRMVITHSTQKAAYTADPCNRESVTVIEAVSAAGDVIDPTVIMKGAVFKEKYFNNDLTGGTLLGMSNTGFTNDMLALEWLAHFDAKTRKPKHDLGCKRLLLMDGHDSHMTYEWVKYCNDAGIILVRLPAHSTHLLQPLDIGVFQHYKHYHNELLQDAVIWGGVDYEKTDFLAILQKMRDRTFKRRTIISSWAKSGLIPFNPQIVLDQMAVFVPPTAPVERPVTPPTQTFDFSSCITPTQIEQIHHYSVYIDKRITTAIATGTPLTPTLTRVLTKRDKGSNLLMTTGSLAIGELSKVQKTQKEKAVRRAGNKHVQKFGVVSMDNGRYRIAKRNEFEDAEVAKIAAKAKEKESAKLKKEERKVEKERVKAEKLRLKEETRRLKTSRTRVVVSEAIDLGPAMNLADYLRHR